MPGNNYCSRHHQRLDAAQSNVFYFKSRKLYSDLHQSRWAIRTVLNGYQQLESAGHRHTLHPDNYLITPQGADYRTEIAADEAVEVLIFGFQPQFMRKALVQLTHNSEQQLDDPEAEAHELPDFWTTSYPRSTYLDQLLKSGKEFIFARENSAIALEAFNYELLDSVIANHLTESQREDLVPAKKPAVRQELFRRLRLARTYMSACLEQQLTLKEIARTVQLSPFHFLRLFKAVYRQSPMQYLNAVRLRKAQYLLQHADESIAAVAQAVSFSDQGAFARWFRRNTEQTPTLVRQYYASQ